MLQLNELIDEKEKLDTYSADFADSVPKVLLSMKIVLFKVIHFVQSARINVEAYNEDQVNVELCKEEILSVALPLKVNYYLNCFLLEKV
jgi:hypothetical protein